MKRYQLSDRANKDIFDIWNYIAADNMRAADDVERVILEHCEFLALTPRVGKYWRTRSGNLLRSWVANPYSNYLIIYEPETNPVSIVTVLHGARNLSKLIP